MKVVNLAGGRVKRIRINVGDEPFCLTCGDGVSDEDIHSEPALHRQHGKIGTLATNNATQRTGVMDIARDGQIASFRENKEKDGGQINGGFMIFHLGVFGNPRGDAYAGTGDDGGTDGRRATDGVPPQRFPTVYGHAARQGKNEKIVGGTKPAVKAVEG